MRKLLKVLVFVFLGLIAIGIGGVMYLNKDIDALESIEIETLDLSMVDDGTYVGTYDQGRFTNQVEVSVVNHEITGIVIVDTVTFEREEITSTMIQQVLESQSLNIDGVAGATMTINAYLKAIENALKG